MSEALSKRVRSTVFSRAQGCCEYCFSQHRFSPDPFSIEHILPKSKGGSNKLDNLALACQGCNNRKYTHVEGIDPVSGGVVDLYHPRQNRWVEHFRWNEDFSLIIGISPVGRATVEKLKLNRKGVVNLRKILFLNAEHPLYLQQ